MANSIIGNCDRHLVLGFQDERTAKYFALRANKLPSTLLETPSGNWWLFERGRRGVCEPAYALEQHPRYREFVASCEMPGDWEAAGGEAAATWEAPENHKALSTCTDGDLDFLPSPGPDDEIWADTLFDADNLDSDSGAAA